MKDKIYLSIISVLLLLGAIYWIFTDTTISKKNDEIKKLQFLQKEIKYRILDKQVKLIDNMFEIEQYKKTIDSVLNILNNKPELNEIKITRRINDIPLDSIGVESERYYQSHKND